MPLRPSTLRPGLLVSLKTSVSGNVSYRTVDIEPDHPNEDGSRRARWETERFIADADEHARAVSVRSKARNTITAVCSNSAFGLLCPETKTTELETAIREARKLADEFNNSARMTQVGVYVMVGRIEQNDVEAVRAINSEVRDLLETMQTGITKLDVKAVRDAADKARAIGTMLSPEASARVQEAIGAARAAARKISKSGEEALGEMDEEIMRRINVARVAFLDIDPLDSDDQQTEVQSPEADSRAVDLMPEPAEPSVTVPALELD